MGIFAAKPNQQPPASGPEAPAGSPVPPDDPALPPTGENSSSAQEDPKASESSNPSTPAAGEPAAKADGADPSAPAAPKTDEPKSGPGLRIYRVNWEFSGFRPETLKEGDLVEATDDEAAPYLGRGGILTPAEEEV